MHLIVCEKSNICYLLSEMLFEPYPYLLSNNICLQNASFQVIFDFPLIFPFTLKLIIWEFIAFVYRMQVFKRCSESFVSFFDKWWFCITGHVCVSSLLSHWKSNSGNIPSNTLPVQIFKWLHNYKCPVSSYWIPKVYCWIAWTASFKSLN